MFLYTLVCLHANVEWGFSFWFVEKTPNIRIWLKLQFDWGKINWILAIISVGSFWFLLFGDSRIKTVCLHVIKKRKLFVFGRLHYRRHTFKFNYLMKFPATGLYTFMYMLSMKHERAVGAVDVDLLLVSLLNYRQGSMRSNEKKIEWHS